MPLPSKKLTLLLRSVFHGQSSSAAHAQRYAGGRESPALIRQSRSGGGGSLLADKKMRSPPSKSPDLWVDDEINAFSGNNLSRFNTGIREKSGRDNVPTFFRSSSSGL